MKKINGLKWWNVAAFSADIMTTKIAFILGAVEANPVMAGWSYEWIASAKGAVLFMLLALKPAPWSRAALWYGGAATTAVVVWNLYQFGRYIWWVL